MAFRTLPRLVPVWIALAVAVNPLACDGQQAPWKFVVFGDSISTVSDTGINTNILGELASAVVQEAPDFVLFLGDFAYLASLANYSLWTNIMGPVYAAGIPIFPMVGNHEGGTVAIFTNFFGSTVPDNGPLEEKFSTYFIRHSNALVLVFNVFVSGSEYRVNQGWLDAVLATNTQPHVFAAGHVPAFKLQHPDCLGMYPTNRDVFWNSLSNAHCRIYFCGHDHFYDHCRLNDGDGNPDNDLHQMTVGTGGAMLFLDASYDGINDLWTPVRIFHEQQYGYVTVTVKETAVTTTWHSRAANGTYVPTTEIFTYSLAPRPRLAWTNSNGKLTLLWSGSASLEWAAAVDGPFESVPGAVSPYPVDSLSGSRKFFRLVVQ